MSNASENQTKKDITEIPILLSSSSQAESSSASASVASEDVSPCSEPKTSAANGSNKDALVSQETENSDNELDTQSNKHARPPPEWIHEGAEVLLVEGKHAVPQKARILSDPYQVNGEWKVQVQWSYRPDWKSIADCRKCKPILASERSKRPRNKRSIYGSNSTDSSDDLVAALMASMESSTPTTTTQEIAETKLDKSTRTIHETPPNRIRDKKEHKPSAHSTDTSTEEKEARECTERLLNMMPHEYPQELMNVALDSVGYPYGLQDVMHEMQKHVLHAQLEESCNHRQEEPEPFKVTKDMKILEPHYGDLWDGRVLHEKPKRVKRHGKMVEVWDVEYEDDSIWQRDEGQLRRFRCPWPGIASCAGRNLQFIEVFSGRCVVSSEFLDRGWKVASIDMDPESNATIKQDLRNVDTAQLPFVCDCLWASPDCRSYSRLAGGTHRVVSRGEFSMSAQGNEHDEIFLHLIRIMAFTRAKHPHCIFIIENPADGSLRQMPLMKEAIKQFDLVEVTVDYCTLGRDEQKPTTLWTNSRGLQDHLRWFRCKERCMVRGKHQSVRGNTNEFDFSVIPQPLANEVARFVDAELYIKKIQRTKAASPI